MYFPSRAAQSHFQRAEHGNYQHWQRFPRQLSPYGSGSNNMTNHQQAAVEFCLLFNSRAEASRRCLGSLQPRKRGSLR